MQPICKLIHKVIRKVIKKVKNQTKKSSKNLKIKKKILKKKKRSRQNQEAFPKEISEFFILQHRLVKITSQEAKRRITGRTDPNFPRTVRSNPDFPRVGESVRRAQPGRPPATGPFITACPSGHLCTEEVKCPPAGRTGGPPRGWPDRCDPDRCPADPTEGDTPEKIRG